MDWYLMAFRRFSDFSGRSRRSEYWYFFLFNFIISMGLNMLSMLTGRGGAMLFGLVALVFALVTLVPSLAVAVRRLHDTGRSGWWLLISFIPFVGAIILIVFLATEGQPGENQWGPNPKEVDPDDISKHLVD